jgi:hypothetical protein
MNLRSRAATACLVCGRPELLGLPVCAACGGTREEVADRLLFVLPPRQRRGRQELRERLAALTGRPARSEALDATARGLRALARIPAAAAPEIVARLEDQGVPVHATRPERAWAVVPPLFVFTLAAAGVAGMLAGIRSVPAFLVLTPAFVGLIAWSAARSVRRPVYPGEPERVAPPELVRVLAELPPGQARELVTELSQAAREILTPEAQEQLPVGLLRTLDELFHPAAQAAKDLAALDQTVADFESRERSGGGMPEGWHQGLTELRKSRAKLAGYLLEVTGLVGRLQGMSADGLSSAGARLRELTRELRQGVQQAGLGSED